MIKISTIIGARPQFIKAAALSRHIRSFASEDIRETIIHTGQHFDNNMSQVFFEQMDIPLPDYSLSINNLSHGAMTGQMIEKIESVLIKENPDWVLVYGDTNSTLAGALAAKKLHKKIAHVEAGLRSFNMKMPEEINRILTDRISDILFCPTKQAINNLINEGYKNFDIELIQSGDIMLDAANFYKTKAISPPINHSKEFILATIHRAENTDCKKNLTEIFRALSYISEFIQIILPLHPRTKNFIQKYNITYNKSNIIVTEPLGYLEMIYLLDNCKIVLTDSGGLQKEAYFFNKNCVTLREETEWVELIDCGQNVLAGANFEKIISFCNEMLKKTPPIISNLYGSGNTASIIAKTLFENK